MRKLLAILSLCGLLLMGGCAANSLRDLKVKSTSVSSLTPSGLRMLDATVSVGLDNPGKAFEVHDISGVLKVDGAPFADLSAMDLQVPSGEDLTVPVYIRGIIVQERSLLDLLGLDYSSGLDAFTVDVKATLKIGGYKRVLEFKDIPLKEMRMNN